MTEYRHYDGQTGNNSATNLRWASRSENMLDAAAAALGGGA